MSSLIELNTFKEIYFWNFGIVQYFKIPIANIFYSFQDYALSFLNNTSTLYDATYNQLAKTDEFNHDLENYDKIFICVFNQKLMVQTVYNNKSHVSIYNTDFSKDIFNYEVSTKNQIIYLWNNAPYIIHYSDRMLILNSLEGITHRVYAFPCPVVYLSNVVCFKKGLFGLAKLINNKYCIFKCGNTKIKYSNFFEIDFAFTFLSIDYDNDLFKIFVLQSESHELIVLSMRVKELLIHASLPIRDVPIPDYQLLPNNVLEKLVMKTLKNDKLHFDLSKLRKLDDAPVSIKDLTPPVIASKVFRLQSGKYFDYFKWIVDNYDSVAYETVFFFDKMQYNLIIQFADNQLVEPLHMDAVSKPFDIFVWTNGKLVFANQTFYTRKLKKEFIQDNLSVSMQCAQSRQDYYEPSRVVSNFEIKKLLQYILRFNIPNTRIIYWTPFQFFKLNMKYIWNRPKKYWENIYAQLNVDNEFEKFMPFLFYNIING